MKADTRSDYQERILRVMLYIQDHLYEELTLKKCAECAHFSPFHFHRIFKGLVGESLKEHIRRLRLERAAVILLNSPLSITEMAFDAGYDTVESFTRAFRNRFGRSPSQYRKLKSHSGQRTTVTGVASSPPRLQTIAGGKKKMTIKIIKRQPTTIAFVRHIGPYNQCGIAWSKLCSWAGPKSLLNEHTQYIGLCYDDPEVTSGDKIRYDATITVQSPIKATGAIGFQVIEGGDYVSIIHKGSLDNQYRTYAYLYNEWFPSSDREMKHAPVLEIYLKDPDRTPPDEMEVDIQIPLLEK